MHRKRIMFASATQLLFACLASLNFMFACARVEPPKLDSTQAVNAVFFEAVPTDDQSDAALAKARQLDQQGRSVDGQLAQLPAQEHLRRAAIYLANRAFPEAREHWQTFIARYPNDPNVPAALFGIGRSFYVERRYGDALPFFDRLGHEFTQFKEGREGFYYVAATLLRLSKPAEAAARYADYTSRFPQGERIENAYLNAIDSFREAGQAADAVQWIARTRERFKGSATDTNALFARLRLDVAGSDWQHALQTGDELNRISFVAGVQTTKDEVAYLRAYSFEREKQTAQAIAAYQAIPDRASSYYGGLATAHLQELGGAGKRIAQARANVVHNEIASASNNYPAPFREIILRAVSKNHVDPRLLLSIMRQESSFNPRARSQAAARGLLQLTIDAAQKYAPRAGLNTFSEDDLYRPEVNIPIGSEYLAELARMFPGLPEAVAASYNGGEDNMERWVRRAGQKDAGVITSEVGAAESKDYVAKVMANYRAYRQLYTSDLRRQR